MQNTSSTFPARGGLRDRSNAPWYERRGWQYGSTEFNVASLVAFLVVGLFPLASFVVTGFARPAWPTAYPLLGVLWMLFMAIGYPAWAWGEARAFERWAATLEPAPRAAAEARFAARTVLARTFWFGVLAVYLVYGVLAFAARG